MSTSRNLIRYAYLARRYNETGNLQQGLVEVFFPLFNKTSGDIFNPSEFADRVKTEFDITIHPYAVEALCPIFATEGVLKKLNAKGNNSSAYVYAELKQEEIEELDEDQIKILLDKFCTYVRTTLAKHGFTATSDDELITHFSQRLIEVDFFNILQKPPIEFKKNTTLSSKTARSDEESRKLDARDIEAQLDYLTAKFIINTYHDNPDDLDYLLDIADGSILLEVVLSLQEPPNAGDKLDKLHAYLDGPFVLALLGLNGDEDKNYAELLKKELLEVNTKLYVFDHYIDEITYAINAALRDYSSNTPAFSYIDRYLMKGEIERARVRNISNNAKTVIEEMDIKVISISFPSLSGQQQFFTDLSIEELEGRIGLYHSAIAKQRDAKSISNIMRLRRGANFDKISSANNIFITSNARLAEYSKKYLIDKKFLRQTDLPPCISDRQVAAFLWLMRGGAAHELSKPQLLVNCIRATRPRKDVIYRAREFLKDIDPEIAKEFEAVIVNDNVAQRLMDCTLGNAKLIKEDNILEIAENIKLGLIEEYDEEFKVKKEALDKETEELLAASEERNLKLRDEILEIKTKEMILSGDYRDISSKLKSLKLKDGRHTKNISDHCKSKKESAKVRCKILVSMLLTSLYFFIIMFSITIKPFDTDNQLLVAFISTLLYAVTLNSFNKYIYTTLSTLAGKQAFANAEKVTSEFNSD